MVSPIFLQKFELVRCTVRPSQLDPPRPPWYHALTVVVILVWEACRVELEELAARVKAGEPGAMLELWEAVRRFVEVKAKDRAKYPGCCVEVCDLTQAGFLAVVETAERFERGQGYGFLHALGYGLKRAFAEATGTRSTKRDAIQYADSADEAAYRDDPDGPTVGELLPDESAAIAFSGVEYADFLTYCRGVIGLALEKLTPAQAAVIRLYYLKGRSMDEAARLSGLSCKQAASDTVKRGLRYLSRCSMTRELRECLTAFEDFHAYGEAAQRETWSRTGISRTEAAALVNAERETA